MRTITTTVYHYNELSGKAQAKAREWYRKGSEGDSFWSEAVIEDATGILSHLGYDIDRIQFRGFWSQGNGACFEGSWSASDIINPEILKSVAPHDEELKCCMADLVKIKESFPAASLSVRRVGHYCHENSTEFDVTILDADGNQLESKEAIAAEKELISISRKLMKWIYKNLEAQYDYINSDEAVSESLVANEYEFTAEGNRYISI